MSSRPIQERLLFIDGLRAIAALWVILYHFYHNSPYFDYFTSVLPEPLLFLCAKGWLGVEIFFVVSGYVIALSLSRDAITPRYTIGFIVRRYIRLYPPYFAIILAWILLTWFSNLLISSRTLAYPSWQQLLCHVFYLQNLFSQGDIVPVTWSLCLEIQFYVLYIVCLLCMMAPRRWMRIAGGGLLWLTTIFSWIVPFAPSLFPPELRINDWFLGTWYLFSMGVFAAWAKQNRRMFRFACSLAVGILCILCFRWNQAVFIGLATMVGILAATHFQKLGAWLSSPIIQYFGRRSYSIYLVHFAVGLRLIDYGYRIFGETRGAAWFVTLAGWMVTLLVVEGMYRLLERPSVALAQKVKPYFAISSKAKA